MKPIRVLVVGMTATDGGIEHFLMAYCKRMSKQNIRFDFLCRDQTIACQAEAEKIGRVYSVTRRNVNAARYYREINSFFAEHGKEYDVIWDNEYVFDDITPLQKAAEIGIPVRIAHCHNPQNGDRSAAGRAQGLLHRINHHVLSRYATVLWASSEECARWACPALDLPWAVIPNAIDVRKFRFSQQIRREVREEYDLTDCLVVGYVGRLEYQKNLPFLLDSFRHLHEREPKTRLVMVGDGAELTELEAKAVTLGIENEVLFLGKREDVDRLLQAFDLFALPSHFEGFGMTVMEAQATGLPCLLSTNVPQATKLTKNVKFLKAEDPAIWAEEMLNMLESRIPRRDESEALSEAGCDIAQSSARVAERLRLLTDNRRYRRRFLMATKPPVQEAPADGKVRGDVEQIACDMCYAVLPMKAEENGRRLPQRFRTQMQVLGDWLRALRWLRKGDLLVMQYPCLPAYHHRLARFALRMLRCKGVTTAAMVHDLPSLQRLDDMHARACDQLLLPRFDALIVPSERMEIYLRAQGLTMPMHGMDCFDYVIDGPLPVRRKSRKLCLVGDLSAERSGYLKGIGKIPMEWQLYGTGWSGKTSSRLVYHGAIDANTAPDEMEGAYGIVWDGSETDRVNGAAGVYQLLGKSRSLSAYLAAGMPIIIWRHAAAAPFVRQHGVGLLVDSLREIPDQVRLLTEADYDHLAENARITGMQLRKGENTRQALLFLEALNQQK